MLKSKNIDTLFLKKKNFPKKLIYLVIICNTRKYKIYVKTVRRNSCRIRNQLKSRIWIPKKLLRMHNTENKNCESPIRDGRLVDNGCTVDADGNNDDILHRL